LPTLRERRGDIPLLLDSFVRRHAEASSKTIAIHDSVYSMLSHYSWPGNVRELENAVERAIALNSSGVLTSEDFTAEIRLRPVTFYNHSMPPVSLMTLAEKEKEYVVEVLAATGQNMSR